MNQKSKTIWAIVTIALVLIVDQLSKLLVKTSMTIGQQIEIFSWFKILFIENNGMAFGISLGSKLFLTLFRLVVISGVFYYLYKLIKADYKLSYIIVIAMVIAGASGNIIDSCLYGQIFSESSYISKATFVDFGSGYAPFFYGKVVDMLYFPIIDTTLPEWFPINAGEPFVFFSPIFNVADSAITVSVFLILIFFRKDFNTTTEAIFSKKDLNNKEQ